MVRALWVLPRGTAHVPGSSLTTVHDTPYRSRNSASTRPTGPPPTMTTGVGLSIPDQPPRFWKARTAARMDRGSVPTGWSANRGGDPTGPVGVGGDVLVLLAKPPDGQLEGIAVAQEPVACEADAGRRAGGDDVTGQQGHEPADVGQRLAAAEDHVARRAVLHHLAVDRGAQRE